jgi:hypothetical protein
MISYFVFCDWISIALSLAMLDLVAPSAKLAILIAV